MLKKFIVGVVVVTMAGGLVGVVAGSAEAKRAKAPVIAVPAKVQTGHAFRIVVRTKHQSGKVVLQRRNAAGHWKRVAAKRARVSASRVTFRRVESRAGRYAYRARLGHKFSRVDRISVTRPPVPQPQLSITVGADTDDIFVNQGYTVSIETFKGDVPLPNRSVLVQRMAPDASTWTTVGTYITSGNGGVSFPDVSTVRGQVQYRATSGTLHSDTAAVIFEVVSASAAKLQLTKSDNDKCAVGVGGSGDINVMLNSTATPGCKVNDYVQATWNLPGICTTLEFDDFTLDGSSADVAANVTVAVDGVEMINEPLVRLGHLGHSTWDNSDPMKKVSWRMRVTDGAGHDFTGTISGARATCW